MVLTFDVKDEEMRPVKEDGRLELETSKTSKASVATSHKRLWESLRERLRREGEAQDLDGLKLLKGYADILWVITRTERLMWGLEEEAPEIEVYDADEITEAMVQLTFSQGAGKAIDGE